MSTEIILCYTGDMSETGIFSILLIALSLSADCFAVALCAAISQRKIRQIQAFRTALAFGAAQAIMPTIGYFAGRTFVDYISSYDHWIVFGLLLIIGGRMIWEAFHEKDEGREGADVTRGWLLLSLAFATSIDSLAVGLSFAFLPVNLPLSVSLIGVVALVITLLGFYLGKKVGSLLGQRAKILGGVILIGIGIRVLVEHLISG
jgi:manganese efflux pump family protein